MKKEKQTLKRILLTMNVAFYTGLGILILTLLLTEGRTTSYWVVPVCGIVGIVPAFGSLFYGFAYFRCPYCNASLMPHKQIPMRIPSYCSACGAHLEDIE